MSTTVDQQTLEAFRLKNFASIQANASALITSYLASKGILSLADFEANPFIDLSNNAYAILSDADLNGLHLFAPYIKNLIIPGVKMNGSTPVITQGKINLSEFKNLENLSSSTTKGGNQYQVFSGDISGLTKLKVIDMATLQSPITTYGLKMPTLSANPNLQAVRYLGTGYTAVLTVANTGNLQNNLALTEFRLTYTNIVSATIKAVVDNVLSSLRAQKTAGGAISIIDFTAASAPTGGAANADAVWLAANGVTVTLGTV